MLSRCNLYSLITGASIYGYAFVVVLALIAGTFLNAIIVLAYNDEKYHLDYDMLTGCPKNMSIPCTGDIKLKCYKETLYQSGCLAMGACISLIEGLIIGIFIGVVLVLIRLYKLEKRKKRNEEEEELVSTT